MTEKGTEQHALELLTELYIMCNESGDFSNGVTYHGIDEGNVMAGRVLSKVAAFLKGKNAAFDNYNSLCINGDEEALPF